MQRSQLNSLPSFNYLLKGWKGDGPEGAAPWVIQYFGIFKFKIKLLPRLLLSIMANTS